MNHFHIGLFISGNRLHTLVLVSSWFTFLMPIEYVLLAISGDHKNAEPTRVLTTKIIELEKF
jgi:hypothetical protein